MLVASSHIRFCSRVLSIMEIQPLSGDKQRVSRTVLLFLLQILTPMNKDVKSFKKKLVGYCHYTLTVEMKNGKVYSHETDDTDLISRLNSPIEEEAKEAQEEAVQIILSNGKE